MNTKLHAVTDEKGRPIRFFMSAGEISDYTGAAALLSSLTAQDAQTIPQSFDRAKPNSEYARLYAASVARRQADQIYILP